MPRFDIMKFGLNDPIAKVDAALSRLEEWETKDSINAHILACGKHEIAFGCLVGEFEFKDLIKVGSDNSNVSFDNPGKVQRCIHLCECKDVVKTGCVDCSSSINKC